MTQNDPYTQFLIKVHEMRNAQRMYFCKRTPLWLAESKRLEREVDDLLFTLTQNNNANPQQAREAREARQQ